MKIGLINNNVGTLICTLETEEGLSVEEAIKLAGGETISNPEDPRWSSFEDNVLIGEDRYWIEDLILADSEQLIDYQISAYLKEQGWTVYGRELAERYHATDPADRAEINNLYEELQDHQAKTFVSYKTGSQALEDGDIDQWRQSKRKNQECKAALEEFIRSNYWDNTLHLDGMDDLRREYGEERIQFVLASTIRQADWDGRYSRANKEWAQRIQASEYTALTNHPCLVDGFTTSYRKTISQERSDFYRNQFNDVAKEPQQKEDFER